jgi:hypothetical protein
MQDNHSALEIPWTGYSLDEEQSTRPGSSGSDSPESDGLGTGTIERPAERRRRERIALIEELGGPAANMKQVAIEAIRRGMYSIRTNRGDVELCLMRTWKLRNRGCAR